VLTGPLRFAREAVGVPARSAAALGHDELAQTGVLDDGLVLLGGGVILGAIAARVIVPAK